MVAGLHRHIAMIDATLDRDDKVIFCPNYKVASLSINQRVLGWDRGIRSKKGRMRYARKLLSYTQEEIDRMFKFTIVRNPFDRTVSSYHYLRQHKFIPAQLTFEEFVENIPNLNLEFPRYDERVDAHCSLQYHRAYYKDEIFVDFVAKLENLDEDWKVIAPYIGTEKLPHANKSARNKDYRVYYDDRTKSIVSEVYKRDMERFEYSF